MVFYNNGNMKKIKLGGSIITISQGKNTINGHEDRLNLYINEREDLSLTPFEITPVPVKEVAAPISVVADLKKEEPPVKDVEQVKEDQSLKKNKKGK